MADAIWTPKQVAERLEAAASTLRRFPSGRPRGYAAFWPTVIHEAMEAYGWNEAVLRRGPPSAQEIAHMDEALEWLRWLETDQVRLLWLRAERVPWQIIMQRIGLSRRAAFSRREVALGQITSRLNLGALSANVPQPPATSRGKMTN